jgi:hypothetical protein
MPTGDISPLLIIAGVGAGFFAYLRWMGRSRL